MSALSDDYIKNFSDERKGIFNKRFSDDYDPNESEEINIIRILNEMRELGLADGGRIGLGYLFSKGGRVAYQDGTPERKDYETPVTDAIKSVNEKTQDLIMKGKEGFEKFTGVDQIKSNYPGSYASPIGQPSDFRHQAASNLVAEALGKGAYTDPILGPISYLSGGIGSFGLGTVKEIGDLVAGLLDKNTTAKDAFSQAYEDTKSNFKGAFAPVGTTSEDLYAELMKDYEPRGLRMIGDPFETDQMAQIFQQRKKALEDAKKKQRDRVITPIKKPTRTVTGTTKPGTGGGGGANGQDGGDPQDNSGGGGGGAGGGSGGKGHSLYYPASPGGALNSAGSGSTRNGVVQLANGGGAGGGGGGPYAYAGGGGGRILPGVGGVYSSQYVWGSGGSAGNAGYGPNTPPYNPANGAGNHVAGGGGGWGASGGNGTGPSYPYNIGAAGGAAITGTSRTLSNSGTIYGST